MIILLALFALLLLGIAADYLTTRRFISLGGREDGGLLGPDIVTRDGGKVNYLLSIGGRLLASAVLAGLALLAPGGWDVWGVVIPGWLFIAPAILMHLWVVVGNLDLIRRLKRRASGRS